MSTGTGSNQLEGHVVMVTGASRGIGRAAAFQLAAEGAHVVVNDVARDERGGSRAAVVAAEIAAVGGSALGIDASVADELEVAGLVAEAVSAFGGVDAVVNNAGIFRQVSIEDETLDGFLGVMNVHLVGSFLMAKAVWPYLRRSPHGRIVNVVSGSGLYGQHRMQAYSAAKAGILGLTHALALEGAEHGITVNAVAPAAQTGEVRTAEGRRLLAHLGDRRTAEYASALLVHLVSPACQVTDRTYVSAGGRYARVAVGESRGWFSEGDAPPGLTDFASNFAEVDRLEVIAYPHDMEDSMRLNERQNPL